MFKVNNVVTVKDCAWSRNLAILRKGYMSRTNAYGEVRTFKVLGVDCQIPVEGGFNANTLIQDTVKHTIFAINDCNLSLKPEIDIIYYANGRDVTAELSKQSKQAVLQAHLV